MVPTSRDAMVPAQALEISAYFARPEFSAPRLQAHSANQPITQLSNLANRSLCVVLPMSSTSSVNMDILGSLPIHATLCLYINVVACTLSEITAFAQYKPSQHHLHTLRITLFTRRSIVT